MGGGTGGGWSGNGEAGFGGARLGGEAGYVEQDKIAGGLLTVECKIDWNWARVLTAWDTEQQ